MATQCLGYTNARPYASICQGLSFAVSDPLQAAFLVALVVAF
jgi:hypothetical protein